MLSLSLSALAELLGDENDLEWNRLKDKVQNSLAPAEERVAAKLKAQITGARTPLALETEFRRYSELMRREAIKNLLRAERQSLLAAYADLIGRVAQAVPFMLFSRCRCNSYFFPLDNCCETFEEVRVSMQIDKEVLKTFS